MCHGAGRGEVAVRGVCPIIKFLEIETSLPTGFGLVSRDRNKVVPSAVESEQHDWMVYVT